MKLWQLIAVLGFENRIIEKYFSGVDTVFKGRTDVDENIVLAALTERKLQYCVMPDNYLRLMPTDQLLTRQEINPIEILSVLSADKKFGDIAITEVIDYGSYNLRRQQP